LPFLVAIKLKIREEKKKAQNTNSNHSAWQKVFKGKAQQFMVNHLGIM
jgi:hypothetical protein